MKILVVGANGFLGRNIVSVCLSRGHSVTGVIHKRNDNVPDNVKVYPISSLNLLKDNFDGVILAVGSFRSSKKDLIELNVNLPKLICSKFPSAKVVFVSSSEVFGRLSAAITEDSPVDAGDDIYAQTKLTGEDVVKRHPVYACVRLTALYGVGMDPDLFMAVLVRNAIQNKKITLFGNGNRKQNYLHVRDAAELVIKALKYGQNGTFLGADTKSYSNKEVANLIQNEIKGVEINYSGSDNSKSVMINNIKTRKKLNWKPKIKLKEGLEEMIFNV